MTSRLDTAYDELLDQYRDRPRILALISIFCSLVAETDNILDDLLHLRGLETAEGVWLDIIGDIAGFPRPTEFVPLDHLFTVKVEGDPDDPDLGFADGPPATVGGYLASLSGLHFSDADLLSDDDYRVLLKAKIAGKYESAEGLPNLPSLPRLGRFISEVFGVSAFTISVPAPRYIEIEIEEAVPAVVLYSIYAFAPIAAGVSLYVYASEV